MSALRKLLREPLVHFIVAGSILFIAGELHRKHIDTYRIVVTPQREAHLATQYALQFGAQPNAATLAQLVERDVAEEMLFRRGLALELERGDEIVRRRIVQKMRFLLQDSSAPAEPSGTDLDSYYRTHLARYVTPARASFTHVYFSTEQGQDAARARAMHALDQLMRGVASVRDLGDAFPDRSHIAGYEPEQVDRLFGQTEFARAVFAAPIERWVGPLRSGYGWHLLYVYARSHPQAQTLSAVRDRVRTDYLLDAQARTNAAELDRLAAEFTVIRDRS